MNPFGEFEEKEQWIIFFISVIVAIFSACGSFHTAGWWFSIAIALTIGGVGYVTALLHRKLSILSKNINLQIRKADEERQQIATALEIIIDFAKQDTMKKKVRKSLNGIVKILTLKGIEDRHLRTCILSALMSKDWKKVISVSTYSLPGEWMDPYWFSYLTLQIARAAELKHQNMLAKRYFIYKKKIAEDYLEELSLLIESHKDYVKPFLYFTENIEQDLAKQNLELIDFTFIEYDHSHRLILWRNPRNAGEVEEVPIEKVKSVTKLICFLEGKEKSSDKKDILIKTYEQL